MEGRADPVVQRRPVSLGTDDLGPAGSAATARSCRLPRDVSLGQHSRVMSVHVSKFLSLVLRHEPERIGIVLDEAGWTDVAALLAACAAHGVAVTELELAAIVASSD